MKDRQFRTEEDFLGKMEISSDKYYGIQTVRAAENFDITGYKISGSLVKALAIVKKAAAKANIDVGLLDPEIGNAIVWASEQVISGEYHDQFIVDPIQGGAGTSINMNGNEVIANIALEKLGKQKGDYDYISPNTHVNMSQSTNDAFPTAGHIAVLYVMGSLIDVLKDLAATFGEKAVEFDGIVKMGRTHLQDAIPIRLGQEFKAYQTVLHRDIERITCARRGLYSVNIGATAVGTALNAEQKYIDNTIEYLREITGMEKIHLAEDLVDATQNTDTYTEISSCMKICMLNLSKIANDLRLMSSGPRTGLNEIVLPPRQPGSSIMPGKVNPVMAELVNQIAFQVAGNDLTISMASEAGQFELNVMEPVLYFNLLQSIEIMTNGLKAFNEYCVKGIIANEKVTKDYVENSVGIITAVNPHIGYEKASEIAKEALETGEKVRDLILEKGYLTESQLDIILDSYEMTNIGISGAKLVKRNGNS